jgi:HemY protein
VKFLIWLLFILGGAVALSLVVGSNDGYVLLVQPPYRLELSLNLLIILLLVGFFSLHGLLRLVSYTLRLPDSVRAHKQALRKKEAHESLLEGLHALVEGRYGKAEKAAAKALDLGEDAGLSALVAARAAHKVKHFGKRDFYLAEAERLAPESSVSRLLTQAELLLDEHAYTSASQVLQQLEKIEPLHPPALKLKLKVQRHLGNWEQVLDTLSQLEKRGIAEPELYRQLQIHAHAQLLGRRTDNREALLAYWKKVPEDNRLDPRLVQSAAHAFIQAGDGQSAAQAIEMSLTREWDSTLAGLYGDCAGNDPIKQLQQAEYWLQSRHDDANLLLSLGKLCIRQELWGKAQSYLEASLAVQPGSAAHYALAGMLEGLGQQEEANRHYRQSLDYKMMECG